MFFNTGKGGANVWGIKDLFWADRFFRWWKRLWDKIAPCEQNDDQDLPPMGDVTALCEMGKEIDSLEPCGKNRIRFWAKNRAWARRFRVNPRQGWWLAMDRARYEPWLKDYAVKEASESTEENVEESTEESVEDDAEDGLKIMFKGVFHVG